MAAPPHVSTAQRRHRLVARHHLRCTAPDVESAVRALVVLHSSDPITPHLALRARVPDFTAEDLDAALCDARGLWRLHAMRRTLFVLHRDDAPAALAAATADIAEKERRRAREWLAPEVGDAAGWMDAQAEAVRELLADGVERSTRDLTAALPALGTEVTLGSGKWRQRAPIGSRLLYLLAMDGDIVRTRATGSWRSSQYAWTTATRWFGGAVERPPLATASVQLLGRYLAAHGPATETDVRWWTGWTARQARPALLASGAVTVALDGGDSGFVLPGDLDPGPVAPPAAAFLPGLDSTPMGWKQRDWFLGEHADRLFDRNGNAGPTVWWDGRVVGGWAQQPSGEIAVRVLEDIGAEATEAVAAEAARLGAWLGDVTVTPRFRTPLEKTLTRDASTEVR